MIYFLLDNGENVFSCKLFRKKYTIRFCTPFFCHSFINTITSKVNTFLPNRGLTFLNLDTDLSESSHPVIETRYSPLSNSDSPPHFNCSQKRPKNSDSVAFSPVSGRGSSRKIMVNGISQSHSNLSKTGSPITISTSTETDDDEGFMFRSRSGSRSTAGSPVFSKLISSTWSYSRNSSPVDAHKPIFFDDSIIDEIGRRRRSSVVLRAEREVRLDTEPDEMFDLEELKTNLLAAKLKHDRL